MRGQKGTAWLGGTRAASLWRWPGTLKASNCPALAAHIDFFPTIADITGAKLKDDVKTQVEGRSLVPLLEDPQAPWSERLLFTHVGRWPKGANPDTAKYHQTSVRAPRWHLVCEGKGGKNWQLFDLKADPGEKTDVAAQHPKVVEELDAAFDRWWSSLPPYLVNENAVGPKENPFRVLFEKQFGPVGSN
jgi:arylsulfatase